MGDEPSNPPPSPKFAVEERPSLPPAARPVFVPPRPSGGRNGSARPPAPSAPPGAFEPPLPLRTSPPPPPSRREPPEAELRTRFAELLRERDRAWEELSRERAASEASAAVARAREAEHLAASQGLAQRLADLERRLEQRRELEARLDELEGQALEVAALRARNLALEAQLAELLRAPAAPARAPQKPLDGAAPLRQIRGIGPAFERALQQAGVVSIEQIAAWSAADIAHFSKALRIKAERIVREDWVGRARALSGNPETS